MTDRYWIEVSWRQREQSGANGDEWLRNVNRLKTGVLMTSGSQGERTGASAGANDSEGWGACAMLSDGDG